MEDLEKIDSNCDEFGTWLRNAEEELEAILRNIGNDMQTLSKQVNRHQDFQDDVVMHSADLSLLNTSSQKFLDSANVYRNFIADFRQMVMSRTFLRSFTEKQETNLLKNKLKDLNERYARLKADVFDQGRKLQRLIDLHRSYDECVTNTNDWLQDAYKTLQDLAREPVSAETDIIRQQIKDLENFKKEMSKHRKDVDGVDDTGRKLCLEQPNVQSQVKSTTDDIIDKYNSLDAQLNHHDRILQDALHQSLDLHNKLKECDDWLSKVETDVQMMDKGKVVVVKKGPMQDQINEGSVSIMKRTQILIGLIP